MPKSLLMLHTNAVPDGDEAEFNRWYDEVHVPDLLSVPGIVRATRYRTGDVSVVPGTIHDQAYRYVVVYELDVEDLQGFEHVAKGIADLLASGIDVGPDIDMSDIRGAFYTPILGPVSSEDRSSL